MKIDVVGWYGRRNAGDEAFQYAMRDFFQGHEVNFVSPPQRPQDGDIIVLGGGAVVSPYYLETLPADKPLYALGVGLEYESEVDLLAQHDFRHVMLRNPTDAAAAKAKLKCPVDAIPDLAFSLCQRYGSTPQKGTIGIFLTDYINPAIDRPPEQFAAKAHNFHRGFAKVCDALVEKGYSLIFVPSCTWGYADDRRVAMDVLSHMKYVNRPMVGLSYLTPKSIIGTIDDFELTICMRFHAHIFSMIAGVPFVSIGRTRKVKLLLDEYDLQETVGAWFEGDEFVSDLEGTIERTLRGAEAYRNRFATISQANHFALHGVKQAVRQSWLGESS
jgi:polysaccharide pyruvyl transferase WcaK-like protein